MQIQLAAMSSLPALFLAQSARLDRRPWLAAKRGGQWRTQSWAETAAQVAALADGLAALGVKPGDRVVLVAENRPEWVVADLAIMAAGAITVPAYVTNTVADHRHVLEHSGAVLAIVSTAALAARVEEAILQTSAPAALLAMEPLRRAAQAGPVQRHGWDQVLALGEAQPGEAARRTAALTRTDTACIIYTSGTGGVPKGVMLSHGAILHNCHGARELLKELGLGHERFLSFLPLSHAYEHTAGLYFPIAIGAEIWFAEGIEHLAANLAEARPTIVTAVPRLYETMRARILKGVERAGGTKARLFAAAVELGSRRILGQRLTWRQRLADLALSLLVRRKVAARFGGRLKAFVSGGAPLPHEVGLFFTALGVRILQGYGQTEAAPVISCNAPAKVKLPTVGPALDGVELRIADDGEICVRGELLMQGYWRDPATTAAAIIDGWLHTGDIGELDEDRYLRITDRKKDIIVNSGGDNIAPQRVEGLLTLQPEIAQAMVHGDRRPHLVAAIVPAQDWAEDWAARQGKPPSLPALAEDPAFRQAIGQAVERVNAALSNIEKVRRFIVLGEAFSIDNAMLTPTLKIRRHEIRKIHGARLDGLY